MIPIPSNQFEADHLCDEDESFDRQLLSPSIFSFFSPHWIASILHLRKKKKYERASLSLIDGKDTERTIKRLEVIKEEYFQQDNEKNKGLAQLDCKIQDRPLCSSIIYETIAGILLFVTPIFILPGIINYLQDEFNGTRIHIGILLMIAFMISEILATFFNTNAENKTIISGIKIKAAISTMIFRKILEVKKFEEVSSEKILKLMSDSIHSLLRNSSILYNIFLTAIIQLIATIAYSFYALGIWAFLSCSLLIASYLIQVYLQKTKILVNKRTLTTTIKQLDFLRNINIVLKVIKMHNWEDLILKSISDSRKLELSYIKRGLFLDGICNVLVVWIPICAYSLTFIGYSLVGNELSPISVFVLIVLYYRLSLTLYGIFKNCNNINQSFEILQEIMKFLIIQPSLLHNPDEPPIDHHPIILSNVTFTLNNVIKAETYEDELTEILNVDNQGVEKIFNVNLLVEQGNIFGVCGKKGSGKTTLLLSILGELKTVTGERKITGDITFMAEQNCLFPGSIQENILFGSPYSEERYQKCVFASALTTDLQNLHKKDETKISDKEPLNSIIEKKICLARTLYRESQIYLLDDPFSILDADIINHFMTHGIQDILKSKTIILVTHKLKYIENFDQILYMSNGEIVEKGTHDELITMNGEYTQLIQRYEATRRENEILRPSISNDTFILHNSVDTETSLEIVDESERRKHSFTKMYLNYMKHSGFIMSGLFWLLYLFYQTIACFNSSFLAEWLTTDNEYQNSSNKTDVVVVDNTPEDMDFYIFPFGLTVALLLLTGIFRSCVLVMNSSSASQKLHRLILKKLLKSPLKFFEENPFAKIIEQFADNLKLVDFQLPEIHLSYLNHFLVYFGSWLQILVIQKYAIIPVIIGHIVTYILDKCYHTTWKNSKKWEFSSRSNFFDFMASVNKGLITIRSFKNEEYFDNKFQALCYVHLESRALRLLFKQWYFFVLNCLVICCVVTAGLIIIILDEDLSTARAALAFSCSLLVISYSKIYLRLERDLEDGLSNVEIMQKCIKEIPLEENDSNLNRPPKLWPQDGGILFQNVSVHYDGGYTSTLKNISFILKPKEKVGLIGKKGSGKSTLVAALFRLLNISTGKIFIDGVDISNIYLKDLRSKMSANLEECRLLPGTIRYNLDPFNKHDELKIWSVLEKLELKQWVLSKNQHLDSVVKHMAFKKRQLLSLGRLLLQQDKIVILELAQDSDNDSLIENIITQEFSNSTVIILSTNIHLLQRCDRIILLEEGEISENGPSASILFNENSSIKPSVLDILLSDNRS